jgi:hypothetical protein
VSRRVQRGQALVELALVLPIFVLALFGVIDGAGLIYASNQLSQAAREGARVAAVEASWVGLGPPQYPSCVASQSQITAANPGAYVCPPSTSALLGDVVSAVNQMTVGFGPIPTADVYLSCNAGGTTDPAPTGDWTGDGSTTCDVANGAGDLVSVRVVYQYNPLTPIAGSIIGSVQLSGSATMVINGVGHP